MDANYRTGIVLLWSAALTSSAARRPLYPRKSTSHPIVALGSPLECALVQMRHRVATKQPSQPSRRVNETMCRHKATYYRNDMHMHTIAHKIVAGRHI